MAASRADPQPLQADPADLHGEIRRLTRERNAVVLAHNYERPEVQEVANERASCAYMKVATLPKVHDALRTLQYRITVTERVATRARLAIERMVSIGSAQPARAGSGVDARE